MKPLALLIIIIIIIFNNDDGNLYGVVVLLKCCKSSPSSRDECRNSAGGRRPLDQSNQPEPQACLQAASKLHLSSPFIITQPVSWHSFYRPTEGRRLSRPRWLATYPDSLPIRKQSPVQAVAGPSVDLTMSTKTHSKHQTKPPPIITLFISGCLQIQPNKFPGYI